MSTLYDLGSARCRVAISLAGCHILPWRTRTVSPGISGGNGLLPTSLYFFALARHWVKCSWTFSSNSVLGFSRAVVVGSLVRVYLPNSRWAGDPVVPSLGVFRKFSDARCMLLPSSVHLVIMFFAVCTALSAMSLDWACVGLLLTHRNFHWYANLLNA